MGGRPFGDEAYELLAGLEWAESADVDVESSASSAASKASHRRRARKPSGKRNSTCAEMLTYAADSPSALPTAQKNCGS